MAAPCHETKKNPALCFLVLLGGVFLFFARERESVWGFVFPTKPSKAGDFRSAIWSLAQTLKATRPSCKTELHAGFITTKPTASQPKKSGAQGFS